MRGTRQRGGGKSEGIAVGNERANRQYPQFVFLDALLLCEFFPHNATLVRCPGKYTTASVHLWDNSSVIEDYVSRHAADNK